MNILHRQMQQVNNALSLIKDYEPFLDSDGKQICTTLQDGVVLEWRNLSKGFDYDIKESSTGGTEYTWCFNTGLTISLRKGDYLYIKAKNIDASLLSNFKEVYLQLWGKINSSTLYDYHLTKHYTITTVSCEVWHNATADVDNVQIAIIVGQNSPFSVQTVRCDDFSIFNVRTLFTNHPNLLPTDADAFKTMFWSEGTESDKQLGYTAYSKESESVIVYNGKLYKMPV